MEGGQVQSQLSSWGTPIFKRAMFYIIFTPKVFLVSRDDVFKENIFPFKKMKSGVPYLFPILNLQIHYTPTRVINSHSLTIFLSHLLHLSHFFLHLSVMIPQHVCLRRFPPTTHHQYLGGLPDPLNLMCGSLIMWYNLRSLLVHI